MKNIVSIIDCDMFPDNANYLFNESVFYQTESQINLIPGMFMQLARDKNERFVPLWRKELEQSCTVPMDLDQVKPFENDKVQLNLLINSNGGNGMVFAYYKNLINHVKSTGGEVNAYISERVHSFAEQLTREADHVNYLEDSEFLWHLPHSHTQTDNDPWHSLTLNDHQDTYRRKLSSYFKNKKRNLNVEELLKNIEDGNLILSGRQVDNFFGLNNSSSSLNEMRNNFCMNTGLTLNDSHPVSSFFNGYVNSSKGFELRLV